MSHEYRGRVTYANGRPLPDVQVRLFDRDIIGSDDDLTVVAGNSDADGRFTVQYRPERSLNFSDIFLPYLQFRYEADGQTHSHNAFIQPFTNEFKVPQLPLIKFEPKAHGFNFVNSFAGFWIPYSIPAIPDIPAAGNTYGLCGGMVAAALDFCLAGRTIPERRRRPSRASDLHQYLHQRQVDSLGVLGRQVVRFARWMVLADEAVEKRSMREMHNLKATLDQGHPAPIGLVYVGTRDTYQIWQNHQVLACSYVKSEDAIEFQLYDPNFPGRNNGALICQRSGADRMQITQKLNRVRSKHVRGFFVMPYTPVLPPNALTAQS